MNVNMEQTHPLTEGRRRKAEGIKDNYECKRRAGGSAERAKSSTFRLYTTARIVSHAQSSSHRFSQEHSVRSPTTSIDRFLVHSQPAQSAFFSFESEHLLLPFIAHSSIIAGKRPTGQIPQYENIHLGPHLCHRQSLQHVLQSCPRLPLPLCQQANRIQLDIASFDFSQQCKLPSHLFVPSLTQSRQALVEVIEEPGSTFGFVDEPQEERFGWIAVFCLWNFLQA